MTIKGINAGAGNEGFNAKKGRAIEVNTINYGIFENIRIYGFKVGLSLYNNNPGATPTTDKGWSEFNQFQYIVLRHNRIGIKMDKGLGEGSFHGNKFSSILLDIGIRGIGIEIKEDVHYYNATFDINAFGASNPDGSEASTLIKCNGNADGLSGTITLENGGSTATKITGYGYFWFDGNLHLAGGSLEYVPEVPPPGHVDGWPAQPKFCCNNVWFPKDVAGTDIGLMAQAQMFKESSLNSLSPMVYGIKKEHVEAIGLNTYKGGPESTPATQRNGVYITRSPWKQGPESIEKGFFLDSGGNSIQSFASPEQGGFNLTTETGFAIRFGKVILQAQNEETIKWSEGETDDIIKAKQLISGRLYITTGKMENIYAASGVFDIHSGVNTSSNWRTRNIQRSFGWNHTFSYNEKVYARVVMPAELTVGDIRLELGTNAYDRPQTLYFHFIGLIL